MRISTLIETHKGLRTHLILLPPICVFSCAPSLSSVWLSRTLTDTGWRWFRGSEQKQHQASETPSSCYATLFSLIPYTAHTREKTCAALAALDRLSPPVSSLFSLPLACLFYLLHSLIILGLMSVYCFYFSCRLSSCSKLLSRAPVPWPPRLSSLHSVLQICMAERAELGNT